MTAAKKWVCENRRYRTNTRKGASHGRYSKVRGSVFPGPLAKGDGYTLWLEHVTAKDDGSDCFWFMWYDETGRPTIPLSGVLTTDGLRRVVKSLAKEFA
jgi:hypothetical protein